MDNGTIALLIPVMAIRTRHQRKIGEVRAAALEHRSTKP